ncbi:TPA: DUF2523 family protein [Raoultella ornithinolytica]
MFTGAFSFIFRGIVPKFFLFFALYYITTEFVPAVIELFLPQSLDISALFSGLPDSIWYFLELMQFSVGVPMVFSAMVTRFIIRRLPVIG